MGFKTDTSFLKFLSIGALGVHQTISHLKTLGFQPIELERYCGSNKIWGTKVKRLRLPDLMCVKTGLRFEVRAKTDLQIKMSDAPNNPARAWDAGLRDDDLAAFISISDNQGMFVPADEAVFFRIGELRKSVNFSKLGEPKSASEGAERDRTWPATVPSRDGRVISVTKDKLIVEQFDKEGKRARKQTYQLKNKTAYVKPGDTFKAGACFLSGVPQSKARLTDYLNQQYDPFFGLLSSNEVDRYAAAKSLPYRNDDRKKAIAALEGLLSQEKEWRVRLEAAGAAVTLGSTLGEEAIVQYVLDEATPNELCMEAILILTELGYSDFTRDLLTQIITHPSFEGREVRQAAIWGLGKSGLKSYIDILPYIADEDENVALHAIAAFGQDTPLPIIEHLVQELTGGDERKAPAASEALRIIASPTAIQVLISAYDADQSASDWIVATLGRMPHALIARKLQGHPIMRALAPLLLHAPGAHWLASEDLNSSMEFLLKQNL